VKLSLRASATLLLATLLFAGLLLFLAGFFHDPHRMTLRVNSFVVSTEFNAESGLIPGETRYGRSLLALVLNECIPSGGKFRITDDATSSQQYHVFLRNSDSEMLMACVRTKSLSLTVLDSKGYYREQVGKILRKSHLLSGNSLDTRERLIQSLEIVGDVVETNREISAIEIVTPPVRMTVSASDLGRVLLLSVTATLLIWLAWLGLGRGYAVRACGPRERKEDFGIFIPLTPEVDSRQNGT
jgi:hypothetical protein